MLYLVVRNSGSTCFRIISGQFDEVPKVGDLVERDPKQCGVKNWYVRKVYDDDMQRKIGALSTLMTFEEVQKLIDH
jgi:hypothetical protein